MKSSPDPASTRTLDRSFFFILLAVLTVACAAVIWPFYGAVFWGGVLALMFQPLYQRLLRRMRGRPTLAALATLLIILLIVILPLTLVTISLVQEFAALYARVKSGEVNFGLYFEQIVAALPSWATSLMDRLGLIDLPALQAKLVAGLTQRGQAFAGRAVDIGGDAIDLVVGFCIAMYLLFFLLRDGVGVARDIRAAIPLAPEPKALLLERFTTVIRATVKGNILVAAAQGALGGIAFWVLGVHAPMLWGVAMAFLSLLPATPQSIGACTPSTQKAMPPSAPCAAATVKGNILVAAAQGALGGIAFWVLGVHAPMLWGVAMAFLSLLPAVGAALIWAPVALYLLATGQVWQGFGLIAFGVFVIGLIDNILRPILVGKDTAMPDYVVLIATVGGLSLFGLNGFVIGPVIVAMFISAWQLLAAERLKSAAPGEK